MNYRTRKKKYYDDDVREWRIYDGSLEAKKKIFFSKFSRFPEFEAKRHILKKIIRKAENEVRIAKGFTLVGTLVSESILYSKIKTSFANYNVITQYRPNWLGRQSLDIFIEELNLAIEYQGDQHSRPVEYFGGVEGFERTKQRDKRKLELCRRNGCTLLYIFPGYDIEAVISEISSYIKK